MENLFSVAESFGHIKLNKKNSIGKQINNLLSKAKEKESNIINLLALRSMSKAEYSTKNIGHHGLSLTRYLHLLLQLEDTQTLFAIGYCPLF